MSELGQRLLRGAIDVEMEVSIGALLTSLGRQWCLYGTGRVEDTVFFEFFIFFPEIQETRFGS